MAEQIETCIACLEHIDQEALAKVRAEYGDLPPLETVDCETSLLVAQRYTNLSQCVVGRWYGP